MRGSSPAMGMTFAGLLALVVILVFSGAMWDILHGCHIHAWWLFPLLLLGIGRFEADEADIAYVLGLVALIASRLVAAITPEF